MLHVYVCLHMYLCEHVFFFPDKVQKLLKSLPSSQQRSLSSPSSSSSTSEYTLHTSDFVSTPTNTLETGSTTDIGRDEDVITHISTGPENLCKTESLGALTANSMHSNSRTASPELTEVNSYPLLHAREKKVRFLPVEKLQRLLSTDTTVAPPPPSSLPTAEVPTTEPEVPMTELPMAEVPTTEVLTTDVLTAEVPTTEVPTAEVPSLSNVQQEEGVESSHSEGASKEALTEIAPENTKMLPAMDYPSKLPLALRNSLPQHNQLLLSVAANRLAPSIPFGNSVTNEEDLRHMATEESFVTGEVHPSSFSVGNIEEKIDRLSSSNESCGLLDEQESRTKFDYGGSLEDNHLQPKGESVSECSSSRGPVDYFTDKLDNQYQSNRFLSPLSEVPKPGSSHTAGVSPGSRLSFSSVEPKVAVEEVEDGYIDSSPSTSSVDKCDNMARNLVPHSLHIPQFLHKSELHSSSVFSSTKYGPIMSAAQSTTLLCGNSGHLSDLATTASGSPGPMEKERYIT